MAVVGCTVGAGQSVTTLMIADLLASLRGEAVAALDLNPGPASLAELAAPRPTLAVSSLFNGAANGRSDHAADGRPARPGHLPRGHGQLDVFVPEVRGDGAVDMGDLEYRRMFDGVAGRYQLTLADPGAAAVARVLTVADQLVLVAPASPDAARALAMTQEWLAGHGYGALTANSITVLNGLSKPQHAARRAGGAAGQGPVPGDRPGAMGRPPGRAAGRAGDQGQPRPQRRGVPAAAAAPTGPAGLHGAGGGADRRAGRQPAAAEGGQVSGRTRGRSRLSVRYFDDRILLTETHAWAYYRLPTHTYEFLTPPEREAMAVNITVALAAIRLPDAEVHLRIAHRSYPAAQWAARLDATSDGGPGWRDYLDEMYRHVWAKDFWTKEVYLGVRLGQRGMRAQLGGGVFSQFLGAYRSSEQTLGLTDEAVSDGELARWTEQSERLGRALSASALHAQHAASEEIAWLFRHALAGTLGDPPPSAARRRTWGAGEIEALLEGQVQNGRTMLRLEHPAGESFVAFLSFSRFPDVMSFPDGEPWLHYADSLPFPVEVSSRMRLIPPAKASKDVGRKLAHARDMDAHIREAGVDLPLALAEQLEAARMLEHGITKERLPFVYGWHRLCVGAPSRELCQRRVDALVEHYRDIGIDVVNSTGDQFSLLCESLPGDRVRLSSYVQRQPLYTIAGGVPTATVDLGDRPRGGLGGRRGRLDRSVHRRDAGPGTVHRPFRPAAGGDPQPAHGGRDHRRAGRRQDHARAAAHAAAGAAGRDGRGHRP